ncbi:MAG TPA: hypothetical protein VGM16_01450 [Gammaproteobacteria bacterium]|jgi:hypothetical protein
MNKTVLALIAVIVVLGVSFAWYASDHPPGSGRTARIEREPRPSEPRLLQATVSAAGVKKVSFQLGVGEVHVSASDDDSVHLRVTIREKSEERFLWFVHLRSEGSARSIADAAISQQLTDGTLHLSLSYPDRDQDANFKQDWDLQLPARLALEARMKIGDLVIGDVTGGVDAHLDVGELSVDVPGGPLHADVNVGEIRAKSASAAHGRIQLDSNIGDAGIFMHGAETGTHERGGLGNHVSLDGGGPDDVKLSVNVGEVSLHLEPRDGGKAGAKDGDGK